MHELAFVGAAFGIGGADPTSAQAPEFFRNSPELKSLNKQGLNYHWQNTIQENHFELAEATLKLTCQQQKFCVIGGEHSCAIGTWSGAATAIAHQDPCNSLGLIWVDAHMDAHTNITSTTGNIHGMPVAALLGQGDNQLTQLLSSTPKIKPENLCLVGIRSFEPAEQALLSKLGVKIFDINSVQTHGIEKIMSLAHQHIAKHSSHIGISIDIDAFDPSDAPGTGLPVENGIRADKFIPTLKNIGQDPKFIGYDIAEFSPQFDQNNKTLRLISNMIKSIEQFENIFKTTSENTS